VARVRFAGSNRFTFRELLFMLFMTALAVFFLLPVVYMIVTAFKPMEELFLFPPRFWVYRPTLKNFSNLLVATSQGSVPFVRYLFNSIFVTSVVVTGSVILGSMCAYPLAKHNVPGGGLIFALILSGLMFSSEVTQIPRYLMVTRLGWMDTYWALIVPGIASPLGLFLMKQFLEQVPTAILEQARVDGANEWQIFWKIVMPMAKAAWSTQLIFAIFSVWNDTWAPLVFTRSEAMKTLPLAIQTLGGSGIARVGAMAAATFILSMPPLIVFLFLQKRVLETMAHSGIKG